MTVKSYDLYVGGAWHRGSGPQLPAVNPFDEQVWATIRTATAADVDLAVEGAHDAFVATWGRMPGVKRAACLFRLADIIEREADRMAVVETTDNGKVIRETKNQMRFAARNYRFFAGAADKIHGETKELDIQSIFGFTTRVPLGVVAAITAWNSPITLLANKLAPALAAGNTVVVKPSEHASVSTLEFAALVDEAGFPPGTFSVVVGAGDVGAALVSHAKVAKVSFTGSVAVGSKIAAAAAANVVPVTLELGGKSANIIFEDANLEKAVPGAVSGIFAAAGQTCVAGSRLLVHERIYDRVVSAVAERAEQIRLGNPLDEATEMGPVAHRDQQDSILGMIANATSEGASLVAGGVPRSIDGKGLFVAPTVFGDVRNDMEIAQREVFGPVLGVQRFSTDAEALAIANDTPFGLAAGVWTENLSRAHMAARELRAGNVWINTYRVNQVQSPSGGFKQSGYGRERGLEALGEYTEVKATMIDLTAESRDPFSMRTT